MRHFWHALVAVLLGAIISTSAVAQSVTTRLVNAGAATTSTKMLPGGTASMDVRLDIVTAAIFGTGFTIAQLAPAGSGFISITGRSFVGSPFTDATSGTPDATVLAAASALLDSANNDNLGRTTVGLVGIPPASNALAVNLTLTASGATPLGTYTIGPTAGLSFATDASFNDYAMSGGSPFTIIVGRTLTVTKSGAGTGTVVADSGAINCGATCSDIYPGTVVTLTGTPTGGSTFAGWSGGGCSGTGTCLVTVDAAKTVNAQFSGSILTLALDVTKSGTGTGTVTSDVGGINCGATCSANYTAGTVVTLTATPTTGVFAGWSGGGCSGTGTCVVSINAAKTVNAQFTNAGATFALNLTKSGTGTGTVTSNVGGINCGATCSADVAVGTVVILTVTSAGDSTFAGWSGSGCSGTGNCVVTVDAAKTVNAQFNGSGGFALNVTKVGAGTGMVASNVGGINCGATCSASFAAGTLVTLTATPTGGSTFAGWASGGCLGTGTCVVTVDAAKTVTAAFSSDTTETTVDLNQHGLTGSWYEPVTSGQGFALEVFPNQLSPGRGQAMASWFTFDTVIGAAERQRWYTAQGEVVTGQPSASLTIYQNTGGNFNASPVTNAQAVGTATLSFDTCSSGALSYSFTDGTGRAGAIPLTRLLPNVTCSLTTAYPTNADFALSGIWYGGPATSGQGFTAEVAPNAGAYFLSWFTYMLNGTNAGAAGQRWYTAQGAFTPGLRTIPVQIYETSGGKFDALTPSGQTTVPVGAGTMTYQNCSTATFSYNFTGGPTTGLSGVINLSRVGPVPPGCAM